MAAMLLLSRIGRSVSQRLIRFSNSRTGTVTGLTCLLIGNGLAYNACTAWADDDAIRYWRKYLISSTECLKENGKLLHCSSSFAEANNPILGAAGLSTSLCREEPKEGIESARRIASAYAHPSFKWKIDVTPEGSIKMFGHPKTFGIGNHFVPAIELIVQPWGISSLRTVRHPWKTDVAELYSSLKERLHECYLKVAKIEEPKRIKTFDYGPCVTITEKSLFGYRVLIEFDISENKKGEVWRSSHAFHIAPSIDVVEGPSGLELRIGWRRKIYLADKPKRKLA